MREGGRRIKRCFKAASNGWRKCKEGKGRGGYEARDAREGGRADEWACGWDVGKPCGREAQNLEGYASL